MPQPPTPPGNRGPGNPASGIPPTHPAANRAAAAPLVRPEAAPGPEVALLPVWQRRWFQVALAALVIFLVLSFILPGMLRLLYAVRSVLLPVLIGLALAYICNPLLRLAERKLRVGRLAGTISLMLLSLVVLVFIMVTAVPLLYEQSGELLRTVREAYPRYVDKLLAQMSLPAAQDDAPAALVSPGDATPEAVAGEDGGGVPAGAVVEPIEEAEADGGFDLPLVDQFMDPDRNRQLLELSVERLRDLDWQQVAGWAVTSLDVGVGIVGSAISFTSYLMLSAVVIAFCFFFFAWRFDAILAWFVPFIPVDHRPRTLAMLHKMDEAVSSFVRGRLVQSLVMMVLLVVGWWWAGVPYWFLLGVITGLLNLVPFLPAAGWIVAVVLTVITTLANGGDFTFGLILWPSVAYFTAQGIDGWVVEPLVQGKATNLDPLTVLLVVLIGGSLAGLLGMLLAIPAAACIKIVCREWLLPRLRELAARPGPQP